VGAVREIRAATLDDVAAIRSILAEHGNDGPIVTADVVGPYVRHLITAHRALVTEEGGEVVAFGAVVDAGVSTHLADLFVRSSRLGQGIGRPLLDALFGQAAPRTTFASDDPRALPVYVRAGMAPLWVSLYLEGQATTVPPPPRSLDLAAAGPAALASLEREWTGHDRSADHAHWASQPDADSFVVAVDGEPVVLAHARTRQASATRVVDRLVVRPGSDPLAPTLAAIRRAGRDGPVLASIQGPSLVDPARLIPNGGML
jgi:GNAT superfamily N-acetyltransferase